MRTVGITRALPGARATAGRVAALGFEPIVVPLIEIRPTGEGPLDVTGAGALAFTSANGVRAFSARSSVRRIPVFTVGAATALSARAAGFRNISSAEGDVAALAAHIQAAPRPVGPILHVGAIEPAGDLIGDLTAQGIAARRLDVYESLDATLTPEALAGLVGADIILLHSPRAAVALARVIAPLPGRRPTVLCLSAAVAAPLEGLALGGLAAATAPTEDALMALLSAWRASA
jgi:uroporphyrinogen-III synthase